MCHLDFVKDVNEELYRMETAVQLTLAVMTNSDVRLSVSH